MATDLNIDVSSLDAPHRKALEEVMGHPLSSNQQLVISVTEPKINQSPPAVQNQSLADWTKIYAGLSDDEINELDEAIKTRANLNRDVS